jgi:hypothetical protein
MHAIRVLVSQKQEGHPEPTALRWPPAARPVRASAEANADFRLSTANQQLDGWHGRNESAWMIE